MDAHPGTPEEDVGAIPAPIPRSERRRLDPAAPTTPKPPCRHCGTALRIDSEACPNCQTRPPFACAECSRGVGPYTLGIAFTDRHPHGGFTVDGRPLCFEHRLARCHVCRRLFPQHTMGYEVTGFREDFHMRPIGSPPRKEEVLELVCPECQGRPTQTPPKPNHTFALVIIGLVILVAGIVAVMLIPGH